MQLFDLIGNISIDGMEKLSGGLNSLGSQLQSIGGGITAFGGALTGALTLPILGVTALGVKYNATMQSLQTDFKVLLGSQEKAVAMTDKLIKMGAATPFESQDLAQATKVLLSFGYTGENVLPIMSKLGDVSLGNNVAFQSLTRTMGQINALGKLQGGDLNQLIGQGWNPLNEISAKTGETMEQVRKRMSAGKVTYKEVEEALNAITSEGGSRFKGMEEGAKTFNGQLSTLKDNFNILVGDLTKPVFDKLTQILPKVISFMGGLSEKFKSLSPEIKTAILAFFGIVAAIGPIIVIVGGAITAIGLLVTAIGTIIPIITAITVPMVAAAGGVALVVAGFMALVGVIGGIMSNSTQLGAIFNSLQLVFATIKVAVMDVITNAWSKLQVAIVIVKDVFRQLALVIDPFIKQMLPIITPLIQQIVVAFGQFVNAGINSLIQSLYNLKAIWDGVFPSLLPIINVVFSAIKFTVVNALEIIKGAIQVATSVMKGNWSEAWNTIKSVLSNALVNIVSAVLSLNGKISSALHGIASSAYSSARSIGSSIIDGIVSALSAGLSWVRNKASEVASSAINAAKSALGIKSPSAVFKDIGDQITKGLVLGIDAESVKETMSELSNSMTLGFENKKSPSMLPSNSSNVNTFNFSINGNNIDANRLFNEFANKLKSKGVVLTNV